MADARAFLGDDGWYRDLASVRRCYLDPGGEFMVGTVGGRLVAFGGLRHVSAEAVELKRMRVDPTFQRRGIGRLLVAQLEHCAQERGFREIRLSTTIIPAAAERLYRSVGYREVGRGELSGVEVIYFMKSLGGEPAGTVG